MRGMVVIASCLLVQRLASWPHVVVGKRPHTFLSTSTSITEVATRCENISSSLELSTFGGLQFINTEGVAPKHRVLFVLGGPGAGKGTQSDRIVGEYKSCHLSVGELLREEGPKSEHKELIAECLVSGKIVPVEISLSLLRQAMDKSSSLYGDKIFLVDGFPRNFDNLEGWSRNMPDYTTLFGALVFDCPEKVLEKRILQRGLTSGRSDDNLASLKKRFLTYTSQTADVIACLEMMEGDHPLKVHRIAGEHSIEEVWEQVQCIMNSFIKNDILTVTQKLISSLESNNADVYNTLCDENFFEQELVGEKFNIDDVEFDVVDGTKAVMSYRCNDFRESRVWQHGPNGWKLLHFTRIPLEEQI